MAVDARGAAITDPSSQETVRQETEHLGELLDDLGHWIDTQLIATNSFVGWVIKARQRRMYGSSERRPLDKAS